MRRCSLLVVLVVLADGCERPRGERGVPQEAWVRAYPDAANRFMAGPDRIGDDLLVLVVSPCRVDRLASSTGAVVWSTALAGMSVCESIAVTGADAIVVAGIGAQLVVGAQGDERPITVTEGRTVVARAFDGGVSATRRNDEDFVVRSLDVDGVEQGAFEVAGVRPSRNYQHFLAALDSGDVVLAFTRRDAPAVTLAAVDGPDIVLPAALHDRPVLQLDGTGAVRRAFVFQSASLTNIAASGGQFVVCARMEGAGDVVALGLDEQVLASVGEGGEVTGAILRLAADGSAAATGEGRDVSL